MRAAIVGASGYVGLELVRIVLRHPKLELVAVTSEQRAGIPVGEAFPALRSLVDLDFESANADALAGRIDVAFTALPHGTSAGLVAELHKAGVTVLDIGADFRLRSRETFQQWYGDHQAPELFGQAVYGMPEVYGAELKGRAARRLSRLLSDLLAAPEPALPSGGLGREARHSGDGDVGRLGRGPHAE